jgi:hypothetical protein
MGFWTSSISGRWTKSRKPLVLKETPILIHEVALHDVEFGVWYAVSATMITGQFFFLRS